MFWKVDRISYQMQVGFCDNLKEELVFGDLQHLLLLASIACIALMLDRTSHRQTAMEYQEEIGILSFVKLPLRKL